MRPFKNSDRLQNAIIFISPVSKLFQEKHVAIMRVYSKFGKILSTILKITEILQNICNICEIMRWSDAKIAKKNEKSYIFQYWTFIKRSMLRIWVYLSWIAFVCATKWVDQSWHDNRSNKSSFIKRLQQVLHISFSLPFVFQNVQKFSHNTHCFFLERLSLKCSRNMTGTPHGEFVSNWILRIMR